MGQPKLNVSQVSVASIDWHVGERGWQGEEARNGGDASMEARGEREGFGHVIVVSRRRQEGVR